MQGSDEIQQAEDEDNSKGMKKYRGGYNKKYLKKPYYNKNSPNPKKPNQNWKQGSQYGYQNQGVYSNYNYYPKIDPMTVQYMLYQAEMYILLKYPHLIDLNAKHDKFNQSIDEKSQFFVIKSFSEEDVHKAIKYNVWTSTKSGNQTLNNAFKLTSEKGGFVYLFFSCNGSGRFLGMSRMKKEVEDKYFPFWTQDNKWGGLFEIEWIFIKDVPFREFKGIVITMRDGTVKPISFSRDTQEVPYNEGKQMIDIIQNFANSNTILEHFEYYDIRQENYERMHSVVVASKGDEPQK